LRMNTAVFRSHQPSARRNMEVKFESVIEPGAGLFPLQIRLFGPFAVRVDGLPMPPLRTRKGQHLLALLVLRHDRDLPRDWLAGTLWPDSDEARALYNLRRSLTDLRGALGAQAHCLCSTSRILCLRLTPGVWADVAAFDAIISHGDPSSLEEAV